MLIRRRKVAERTILHFSIDSDGLSGICCEVRKSLGHATTEGQEQEDHAAGEQHAPPGPYVDTGPTKSWVATTESILKPQEQCQKTFVGCDGHDKLEIRCLYEYQASGTGHHSRITPLPT